MNYPLRKPTQVNGQDVMIAPLELEFSRRILTLEGEITSGAAAEFNAALRCLARESDSDITVYITSPGGEITAGMSIYDTIQALPCDVRTVASGLAASMSAFLLAAAGTKGKRWVQPNAEVLIHQPLGHVNGQTTDIQIHAEHIRNIRARINEILADCTAQPIEQVEADTERDHYMSAEMAVAYGLADHIGDPISDD